MPQYWGVATLIGGVELAAAPSLISTPAFVGYSAGATSRSHPTTGVSWLSGDWVDSFITCDSSPTVSSAAGSTDDTASLVASETTSQPLLYLHNWTVVGGALDANLDYTFSGTTRNVAGIWTTRGVTARTAVGVTGNNAAPLTGPTFLVTGGPRNVLAMQLFAVRGAHVSNPPLAPSGYTLISQAASAANSPADSSRSTVALAYRVYAAGDLSWSSGEATVPAATWLGLSDYTSQVWRAMAWGMLS